MSVLKPETAEQLAGLLQEHASQKRSLSLLGNDTKFKMGGPALASDISITTGGLDRVLEYEPNDLTISVEAGMKFSNLQALLAKKGQMIALDPPFASEATVGGIVAANSSGPMRRHYGTARDLVIGMTFATLEGKLVQSGGMVVKNVAGLDMGKLMIGSFGTLAAITSVNFRIHSLPEQTRTYLFAYPDLEHAIAKRDTVLRSVLQPIAIDLLSPATAVRLAHKGHVVALRAGGSARVLERYDRDLAGAELLSGEEDRAFWQGIREFTPEFLSRQPDGIVLRVSTTLSDVPKLFKTLTGPYVSRAANGVTYVYASSWSGASRIWKTAVQHRWPTVVEFASHEVRRDQELWHVPTEDAAHASFVMMEKIKSLFDSGSLLNRKRLYGRL